MCLLYQYTLLNYAILVLKMKSIMLKCIRKILPTRKGGHMYEYIYKL